MKSRSAKSVLLVIIINGVALIFCLAIVIAQRPRQVNTRSRITRLKVGDDLQRALRAARLGDTILLPAGATYRGPIVLPFKSAGTETDADYIVIKTEGFETSVVDRERVQPALHNALMAKILAPNEQAAVTTEPAAHHYKFIGVEFSPAVNASYVYNVIDLGASDYKSYSQFPHHLIFDRCYVHSTGLNRARRGFALNSAETSILNSHVSGFAGAGDETQAIAGWNGPGPFHITNNYLEAAGEVMMFGGADPSISNLVPSDIEIRRNHFNKLSAWLGRASIKGTFELKNARRVKFEGNLIESEVLTTAVVLTVRNQGGKAPWSTLEDIQISNNVVRNASTGINFLGTDNEKRSQEAKRIRITNNLFLKIVANDPSNIPYFLQTNGGSEVVVEHNTVQQDGNIITAYGNSTRGFVFRDNIIQFNRYGIVCLTDGGECGSTNMFCNCFPNGVIRGNVFADNLGAALGEKMDERYPSGNYFVSSLQKIGSSDAQGNWSLNHTSRPWSNAGVNLETLRAAGAFAARTGKKF